MNINNLRIGQRLAIGFGIVISLLVLLAGLSYSRLASLNDEMAALIHLRYANTVSANAIKADVNEATRGMLSVLVMSCLLYTSPSPRDRQKSRMPSSA